MEKLSSLEIEMIAAWENLKNNKEFCALLDHLKEVNISRENIEQTVLQFVRTYH